MFCINESQSQKLVRKSLQKLTYSRMRLDAKLGLFALGVAVRRAMCGAIDGVISVVLGMVASEHVFDFVCDVRHIV